MKFLLRVALTLLWTMPSVSFAQQDYVGRFDIYNGFAYFDSPSAHLTERGYHLQAGVNATRWLSLGFDFSDVSGNVTLVPSLLKSSLVNQIGGQLASLESAGVVPLGYQVAVGTASTTQTYAGGPQLEFRHFKAVTLFVHPSIGAIHETATPHPHDFFTTGLVQQLATTGKIHDWEPFYGVGGGFDLNLIPHLGLRIQADYVHNDLFTNILAAPRNTVRLSVGPTFHFGPGVTR
jgi:hypothetical protein